MNPAEMESAIGWLKHHVDGLRGMTIAGMERHEAGGRIAFGRALKTEDGVYAPPKTVVITVKPETGHAELTVREAKYINLPPKPCTDPVAPATERTCYYEWYGIDFNVSPPMGTEAVDFAGDEYTGADPPKLSTVFHRVHREHEVWVIEKAGGGGSSVSFAIVREVHDQGDDTRKIKVEEVKMTMTVSGDIEVGIIDGEKYVWAWPGLLGIHYAAFKWAGGVLPGMPILAVVTSGGASYLQQFSGLRYRLRARPRNVRQTDCIAQGGQA